MYDSELLERPGHKVEQDAAQKKYERLNADMHLVNNIASHGLKSPLNIIATYTGQIEEALGNGLDPEVRESIGVIKQQTERMRSMVSALFEYTAIELNSEKPRKPVNCQSIVEGVVQNIQGGITQSKAVVQFQDLPVILGRERQIMTLFAHLIDNAIKFHGDAPPIVRITAQRQGELWRFAVADNGIGIEEEFHEIVFLLFQRLHGDGQYSGIGIGLALAKKIVECGGGTMELESEVGKGSTVYFTLPAA